MDLFGSSLVDMMERDMKDSMYDSVYYPSLGSSPLFPDLIGPAGTLDCSLDHLDPGIMVDPAVVVPRRHTEQHHQAKPITSSTRDDFILPDIINNSKMLRVEVDESSEEEEDDDDDDQRVAEALPVAAASLARHSDPSDTVLTPEHNQLTDNKRKLQQQQHHWTMVVNKKSNQKVVSGSIMKIKREVERSPSLTRSPSAQAVRSPSVVRSPTVVRSPGVVRSPSVTDSPPYSSKSNYHQVQFPKPAYSYSCLIAMALKNSPSGSLPVSEIYNFMCEHFPYFKSAPPGWKNSVRHNLSLNKCFEKIEKSLHGGSRKGCLWALNPDRMAKMDEEVAKWRKKDPEAIKQAMARPETLDRLERGDMKIKLRVVKEEEEDDEEEDEVPAHRLTTTPGRHVFIKGEVEEEEEEEMPTHRLSSVSTGRHVVIKEEEEEEEEDDEVPTHRLAGVNSRHLLVQDDDDDDDDEEEEEEDDDEEEEQSQDDQSDEEGEIPPSLKPFDRQLNSRLNPNVEQTDIGVEFSEEVYEELGLLEEVLEEEAEVYRVPVKRSRVDHRPVSSQSYHKQAIASLL